MGIVGMVTLTVFILIMLLLLLFALSGPVDRDYVTLEQEDEMLR